MQLEGYITPSSSGVQNALSHGRNGTDQYDRQEGSAPDHRVRVALLMTTDGGTDDGCLYIADVVHQAFVSVDESGTEAAASISVVLPTPSPTPRPLAVRVDRPFVFLMQDRPTGTALFVGRVTGP